VCSYRTIIYSCLCRQPCRSNGDGHDNSKNMPIDSHDTSIAQCC
jgi:hypothetical protein